MNLQISHPVRQLLTLGAFFTALVVSATTFARGHPDTTNKPQESKNDNSYYYFLLSQIKDTPGQEIESDAVLNQALQKDPKSSYLLGQRSLRKARNADFDSALNDAKAALSRNPNDPELLLLVGKLYAAKKQPQTAITFYRRALTQTPDNEEIYNILAREYLSMNNRSGATAALQSCLSRNPESLSCLYYLGSIYIEGKQYDQALKYYKILADLNPDNTKVLETIVDIYVQRNQNAQAIDALMQLKRANPDDFNSQIRLGLIYSELKQTDKAIAEFESITDRFPEADRLHYFLGLLYLEKRNYDQSIHHFSSIPKGSKFYFEAVLRQGLILKEQHKIGQAIALLNNKLGSKSDSADWYELKSSFLIFQGSYRKALDVLSDGLVKFPGNSDLLFQRAIVFDKLNRWEDAKTDLNTILSKDRNSAKALNYLGYTMAIKGEDLNTALKYTQRAASLHPGDGYILDSLGWVYFKRGNVKQALNLLLKAHKLEPEEPTVCEHLGDVYVSQNNSPLARQYYACARKILESKTDRDRDESKQLEAIKQKLEQL